MTDLLARRFISVLGKGGCGKTMVSLLIGQALADQGKKALVCLTGGPAEPVPQGWPIPKMTATPVSPNLFINRLDPVSARAEYGKHVLKNRLLHRLLFSNRAVNAFLDAVPGLSAFALLGKATYHAMETTPAANRYDTVVFDAPATGHGLDMLRLPALIAQSTPAGQLGHDAADIMTLLRNTEASLVIPVTVAEELPVSETCTLVQALRNEGLPIAGIVVNRLQTDHPRQPPPVSATQALGPNGLAFLPTLVSWQEYQVAKVQLHRMSRQIQLPLWLLEEQSQTDLDTRFGAIAHKLVTRITGASAPPPGWSHTDLWESDEDR